MICVLNSVPSAGREGLGLGLWRLESLNGRVTDLAKRAMKAVLPASAWISSLGWFCLCLVRLAILREK